MIKADQITKQYVSNRTLVPILGNISFELGKKEVISIVGKTGCGKTTLLNIISGLLKPTSGQISIKGRIGYVLQRDLLLPWRTVLENILLPAEINHLVDEKCVSLAKEYLKEFGLERHINSYPDEISGGMRQKVSLIRTFVQNPDIILLDEPFSAIDFHSRLELVERFRKYILQTGKSAIFVTHNIEEAISISDRVIVLGSKPARIIYQEKVNITEDKRNLSDVRATQEFNDLFKKIWEGIGLNYE